MEDLVYYNELFEIYADLLTDKEQETYKDYHFEDLSLSEIAENNGISRAAVQKTIKVVKSKLDLYEKKLHIYKNRELLKDSLELTDIKKIKENIKNIIE